ncbi:uncharacterized protein LOC134277148 [Saccostrea cucullata]|uniref:uncharacterized protein LOC134277148 n=1 Tax=Saccostrea cuccullata TaxID=36930 RepID=UPI002ED18F2F
MEDRSKEKHREYCKARNKVKRLTRKERKEKERQVAESAKTNNKNFWKYVNSKRKSKSGVSELHEKTSKGTFVASKDQDKAEVLANFFSSVFTEEDVNSLPLVDITIENTRSTDDEPITQEEKSLETGIVPDSWKVAIITALFKKGDKKSASNYRPVSLTSILCKMMEKIFRRRIIKHMDSLDLFSDKQFGFLSGRSTTLQLITVLDKWTEILDRGGVFNAVYMDFMKAFDKFPSL